jgi:class 3 adenylate cyclase
VRFGTKILLLTLAITVGLGGIVVLVVRSQITREFQRRARDQTAQAADRYFEKLDAMREIVAGIVSREMEDTANRSQLELLEPAADPEQRNAAQEQFKYTFSDIIQAKMNWPVSFQALVTASGRVAVATVVDDGALAQTIDSGSVKWRVEAAIGSSAATQQFFWINNKLYLAFAVPVKQTQDEGPSHVYFIGFRVTDDWLRRVLIPTDADNGTVVTAYFLVDYTLVARNSDTARDPKERATRMAELIHTIPIDVRPGERYPVQFTSIGEQFLGQGALFEPAPGTRGVIALYCSLDQELLPLRKLQRMIALITAVAAVLAVFAARWIARRLARPVEQLVEGTQRIAQGDFTHSINIQRNDELGELARSFNEMAMGLAQRDLIKDTLGQFVDPRIADALLTNPASLRGQRVVQSVLFSDLEKFTSISEKLPPETLVQMLNRFLGASADVVKGLNGYLDKFLGDGVIAFWGPPVEVNHSVAACRAGLKMIELAKQFRDPPLRVRVGIATGEVLVGIIGSESSKKNYTAMGDVVNLASRLEGANKVYGTQILIDARTAVEIRDVLVTRQIDVVRVLGRAEPVELYEVLGEAGVIDGAEKIGLYERATGLYKSRRWSDAREAFSAIGDEPSRVMSSRCEAFIRTKPAGEWDGVWNLEAK